MKNYDESWWDKSKKTHITNLSRVASLLVDDLAPGVNPPLATMDAVLSSAHRAPLNAFTPPDKSAAIETVPQPILESASDKISTRWFGLFARNPTSTPQPGAKKEQKAEQEQKAENKQSTGMNNRG
ncbi:hypothetical protein AQUSIP_19700 [Aquicella siphonis]|uniref:Uncharacterized protein n=1 Tax=Aquicella siphonis TaxID=254247 RepID=A0A5E4PJN9_9COXI|nr:hypothetical protein [Aquicella siphonis]VVC76647.1 hypothetical protein AQUSIP_19700 [Aquicella siphonis]